MEGRHQKLLLRSASFLLGLTGVLLYLAGPMFPAGARGFRVLQVWPDRSVGVTSGLLEGSNVSDGTEVLPFGVCRTSAGGVVRARTYLHFSLDVFPPGTEILRAALYMYVDGGSGVAEATFGAYRVLEPWKEERQGGDPATWPMLLASPIAAAAAHFDVVTPTLWVPSVTPSPIPTVTPTGTLTATFTPTPPTSPLPTPTATPSAVAPTIALGRVRGTWLTWDITALMRAWQVGEVPNDGLALAPAPHPDADPETTGDLLVARWLTVDDPDTRPYLIVEMELHPVTPTPVSFLPPAGGPVGWGAAGLLLTGAALLILGLAVRRK